MCVRACVRARLCGAGAAALLDGTETTGSARTGITIMYGESEEVVHFRVHYPSMVTLVSDDSFKNLGWHYYMRRRYLLPGCAGCV